MLTRFRTLQSRLGDEEGFSIVELALVVVLISVVFIAAFNFLFAAQRHESRISNATQQDQAARTSMERVSRVLREARYPQGMVYTNSAIFETGGPLDVTFYSDSNNDSQAERTRLYVSGTKLYKTSLPPDCSTSPCTYPGTPTSGTPIVDNVKNGVANACGRTATLPMFTYFTKTAGGGAPTQVDPGTDINKIVDIFQVAITIQVQQSSLNAPACQTLQTTVQLRNWRY